MEQLVILIVIAAISLINWLLQKSAAHKEKRARERAADEVEIQPPVFEKPKQWHAPEDELRKFMDALGIPTEEIAPPAIPVPDPVFVPEPPPLPREPTPIIPAPPAARPPRPQPRSKVEMTEEMRELALRFQEVGQPSKEPPVTPIGIRRLLTTREDLREAVVLREILGPPRGLQPEQVGLF